jgi:cbb3-type cytochrome oxidase subunit 1
MPRLSVWFIRASLAHLLLGFTFGGLLLFHKGFPLHPLTWRLLPAHIEFVLFGWTAQLVMGMAFWILPRFPKPPVRGNERLAWGAFWALNAGIALAALAPFVPTYAWLSLGGRLAEALGVVLFARHAWPRVKAT